MRNFNRVTYLIATLLWGSFSVFPTTINAQGRSETILFQSVNPNQWIVTGRVNFAQFDSSLNFIFSFDEINPPRFPPDTTELEIAQTLDLSGYDSIFVVYNTFDILPHIDTWVDGNIRFLVKNEYQPNWQPIGEDLSSLGGWARQLKLKMQVAVRTSSQYPGAFKIENFKIVAKRR